MDRRGQWTREDKMGREMEERQRGGKERVADNPHGFGGQDIHGRKHRVHLLWALPPHSRKSARESVCDRA